MTLKERLAQLEDVVEGKTPSFEDSLEILEGLAGECKYGMEITDEEWSAISGSARAGLLHSGVNAIRDFARALYSLKTNSTGIFHD
jgi:hypothetical protein